MTTSHAYLSDCPLQDKEYRENNFHTGWLDSRIAMRVRVERPPWNLSVVGGALYVRHTWVLLSLAMRKSLHLL